MVDRINFFYDTKSLQEVKTPKEVAKSFEAILYSFLMKELGRSLSEGHSFSYSFYFDMFLNQMAQVLADSGQTGLGEYIQKAIEQYQKNQKVEIGQDTKVSGNGK